MNRITSSIVGVVAVIAMTFGVPGWATATLILDQTNLIDTSGSNWTADEIRHLSSPPAVPVDTYDQLAQTFTVGVAGTLYRVDVEAYHVQDTGGTVHVDLWATTAAGVPDPSVVLDSWGISDLNSSTTVGSFVSLDLGAAAFAVLPGQVYAIAFSPGFVPSSAVNVGGRFWVRGTPDPYGEGDSFYRIIDHNYNGVTNFQSDLSDYGFRTFVDVPVAAIPEPSTMLLLGFGLFGLWGLRRKFKK